MTLRTLAAASAVVALAAASSAADPKPAAERHTFRAVGLFAPDRVEDLRAAFADLPDLTLVSVDYDAAELTVEFVPAKAFPGAKPDQLADRLDQRLRGVTYSTLGAKPRWLGPRDRLREVVVPVAGLDCKACALAAYEAVAALDGVERATASFKDRRVTARVDPDKVDREALEAALRKKGVTVTPP